MSVETTHEVKSSTPEAIENAWRDSSDEGTSCKLRKCTIMRVIVVFRLSFKLTNSMHQVQKRHEGLTLIRLKLFHRSHHPTAIEARSDQRQNKRSK